MYTRSECIYNHRRIRLVHMANDQQEKLMYPKPRIHKAVHLTYRLPYLSKLLKLPGFLSVLGSSVSPQLIRFSKLLRAFKLYVLDLKRHIESLGSPPTF